MIAFSVYHVHATVAERRPAIAPGQAAAAVRRAARRLRISTCPPTCTRAVIRRGRRCRGLNVCGRRAIVLDAVRRSAQRRACARSTRSPAIRTRSIAGVQFAAVARRRLAGADRGARARAPLADPRRLRQRRRGRRALRRGRLPADRTRRGAARSSAALIGEGMDRSRPPRCRGASACWAPAAPAAGRERPAAGDPRAPTVPF